MNPRSEAEVMALAVSEAARAIAARELEVPFDQISIAPQDGSAGRAGGAGDDAFAFPPGTDPDSPENAGAFRIWAETRAVVDYAGHAAIVAMLGIGDMSCRSGVQSGAKGEFDAASKRLGRNRRRIRIAKDRAVEIVSRRQDDIRTIAELLVERQSLSAQQMDWTLGGHLLIPII